MRLRKLTLNGFKSFADPTEFTFDEAVIGVVGPNGCGKSNIVDAVKWVLGERSSKSLRGKEMIDVIFAGSAGRKPSGLASVTLSFDNPVVNAGAAMVELQYGDNPEIGAEGLVDEAKRGTDEEANDAGAPAAPSAAHRLGSSPARAASARRRGLPIDADVVEVERRLYRDGTSKYLINGRIARLRDIRDLFLDTGIGADAYSIIEQGKVDAMLLASPQERRVIFEEAAGIARYKQRRIESQRKLEKAQANLSLTREQLASTERRLRIVRGQAAKARKFKELDSELRGVRLALAFEAYDDLRQRLDGLTSRLSGLEATRDEATGRVAAVETAKQEAELARHELLQRHKLLDEQKMAARHAEHSAWQRKTMAERALEDARLQLVADESRLVEIESRIAGLEKAAEEQRQQIAQASERLAETERQAEAAGAQRAAVLEERAEKQGSLAERRAAAVNIDRERAALLASVEAERRREESLREQGAKVEERRAALGADLARAHSGRESLARALEERRGRAAGLERELAQKDAAAASLSRERRDLAGRVSSLEQAFLKLDSRRAALQEMVETRAGLDDAVRAALEAKEAGTGFAGVIAPLADLIETGREHAAAVEAALGPALQALVVPTIAEVPSREELAGLPGRVMFVPLAGLSERGPQATPAHRWREDPPEPAFVDGVRVVPVRMLVRPAAPQDAASAVAGLIERLLGATYLVESLDSALMLAALSPGSRFVTRDGAVMEPDGRIVAGPLSAKSESGVLQRRSELAELEMQAASLGAELAAERAQLQGVDAEVSAISGQQSDLRSRLAGEQRALVGEQARAEQLAGEVQRLSRDDADLADESRQLASRLCGMEEERARLRERIEKLSRLHDEQAGLVATLERELTEIGVRAEQAAERITALRVEAGRLAEQAGQARREHRRLELAIEGAGREQRDLARVLEQARARLTEHERTIAAAAEQIRESGAEAVRLEALAGEAQAGMEEANAAVTMLGEQLNLARVRAQQVERDWHALEVSRRELEVKRENLEERTQQELELDLAWEYPDYRRLLESGGVARIDTAAAAAEADLLRDQIKALGNVNLEALDEEGQLEQRNEELIRQVADIDDAATKLTELIETLNAASKERFGEIFARIQEHFAGPSGMFRKLFGGGKAEVRLMPLIKEVETAEGTRRVETDEVDLLESGIEVIARPPGKEPRSISQLSGGEKTLTAVALLLAIFQSKPSCFCILDEVDAALDESNVSRYCGVVREFTTHSHFIVITHNKKTMQAADRLYGVTMQERGVSTRVSVKFEQVAKDGSIAAAPAVGATRAPALPEDAARTNGDASANGEGETTPRREVLRRALAGMRDSAPAEA
ncbi:MAG: chromosome segregation protein SMC [Phycisphaerales bacterium]